MATNKTVFEDGVIGAFAMESALRPVSNKGLICEVLVRTASSNAIAIWGAGHASAGADDCKIIQQIVGCLASPLEDASSSTDDTIYATISTNTNTDDKITIASPGDVAFFILVFGYPEAN